MKLYLVIDKESRYPMWIYSAKWRAEKSAQEYNGEVIEFEKRGYGYFRFDDEDE